MATQEQKLYENEWFEYTHTVPAGSNLKMTRDEKLARRKKYNQSPQVKQRRREYERTPDEIKQKRKIYAQQPEVRKRRKIVSTRRRQASAVLLGLGKNTLYDHDGHSYEVKKNFVIKDGKYVLYTNRWSDTIHVPIPENSEFDPEQEYYDPKNHVDYQKSMNDLIETYKEKHGDELSENVRRTRSNESRSRSDDEEDFNSLSSPMEDEEDERETNTAPAEGA
jgi:hemin uptake protein HemP